MAIHLNPDFGYIENIEKQHFDVSKEKIKQLIPISKQSFRSEVLDLEIKRTLKSGIKK